MVEALTDKLLLITEDVGLAHNLIWWDIHYAIEIFLFVQPTILLTETCLTICTTELDPFILLLIFEFKFTDFKKNKFKFKFIDLKKTKFKFIDFEKSKFKFIFKFIFDFAKVDFKCIFTLFGLIKNYVRTCKYDF